ncbi:MAG: hypothetical protein MUW56_13180 [Chryseobacterium sp.]|uniref:hypothetical protein n=1 Tax=Chryseobacterium sp. TaxID=1871047 RepID=UPI0025C3AD08|nr:hypothetical protein [Chryseobacterium sp.]MCJ7934547.1 hypothetical protein [Chryseobacterium sp.]
MNGGDDNSYSAELWDGDDFLVWGAGEINPYGKISHAKFREYGFIKIDKDIYEKYKNVIVDKYFIFHTGIVAAIQNYQRTIKNMLTIQPAVEQKK